MKTIYTFGTIAVLSALQAVNAVPIVNADFSTGFTNGALAGQGGWLGQAALGNFTVDSATGTATVRGVGFLGVYNTTPITGVQAGSILRLNMDFSADIGLDAANTALFGAGFTVTRDTATNTTSPNQLNFGLPVNPPVAPNTTYASSLFSSFDYNQFSTLTSTGNNNGRGSVKFHVLPTNPTNANSIVTGGDTIGIRPHARLSTATPTQGTAAASEVQRINLFPTTGTPPLLNTNIVPQITSTEQFVMSFEGVLTTPLTTASTAAQIQAALEALSNIGPGNVLVTGALDGSVPTGIDITFQGTRANQDVQQLGVRELSSVNPTDLITDNFSLEYRAIKTAVATTGRFLVQVIVKNNTTGITFRGPVVTLDNTTIYNEETFYTAIRATDLLGNGSIRVKKISSEHLLPTDDSDGDGLTNLQEVTNGFNPLSSASNATTYYLDSFDDATGAAFTPPINQGIPAGTGGLQNRYGVFVSSTGKPKITESNTITQANGLSGGTVMIEATDANGISGEEAVTFFGPDNGGTAAPSFPVITSAADLANIFITFDYKSANTLNPNSPPNLPFRMRLSLGSYANSLRTVNLTANSEWQLFSGPLSSLVDQTPVPIPANPPTMPNITYGFLDTYIVTPTAPRDPQLRFGVVGASAIGDALLLDNIRFGTVRIISLVESIRIMSSGFSDAMTYRVQFNAKPNTTYNVDMSTDLVTFTELFENPTTDTNGNATLSIPLTAPLPSKMFFRIRE